jgi:peptidoglycan/xylan/chitin deacetylase (PgdA/CDA1 family)
LKEIVNVKRLLLTILVVLALWVLGMVVWIQGHYVVPILMYHRVSLADEFPMNTVSPKAFARQMDFIDKNGYHVIGFDELVEGTRVGKKFPHNTVVITFDDGYRDNYNNAFPVLNRHHFPATIFLISDFLGINPNLLDWDQVKEMGQYGITFGSHTRHHVYLPEESEGQLKDEIRGSKRVIEEHLGKPVYYFSYPSGGFSEHIKTLTAMAGYKAAVATNRGYDRYNIDVYELSRIRVNGWDSPFVLWNKLSGYYNLFRKLRSSH